MKVKTTIKKHINNLNIYLEKYINLSSKGLCDSLKYSMFAPCKRLRPLIMISFYELCGGKSKEIYKFASALEMIHTFSLIHDDLPCMDNDIVRRGKKCSHIEFGENIALLTGDAFLSKAFEIVSEDMTSKPENVIKCINILASEALNMIIGQYEELNEESNILNIYKLKTGALFKAAAKIGVLLAQAEKSKILLAEKFADNMSIYFQMVDDVLDKDLTLKDSIENKSVLNWIKDLKNECICILKEFKGDYSILTYMLDFISLQISY